MVIKNLMGSFKKSPVNRLNIRDLQEEEIRLKNRMDRLRKDINKLEKDKKQKFQNGVGADMVKKKMLAREIEQLDTEARLKLKNFTTINKQCMFVSNLIVIKKYENDLKKNKIWDKISNVGSENFENALIMTNLVGKGFEDVLSDLNRVFEGEITDFEIEEDGTEAQLLDAWSSVESGATGVDETEQNFSFEKSPSKDAFVENETMDKPNEKDETREFRYGTIREKIKNLQNPTKSSGDSSILKEGVTAEEFNKILTPIKALFMNLSAEELDAIEDSNLILSFRNSEPAPEKADSSNLKPHIKTSLHDLEVSTQYVKKINMSLVHNDIPIVEKLSIDNTSKDDIENIIAGLWVSPDYSDSYETSVASIPKGTKIELSSITPPFYSSRLKQVVEAEKAILRLKLTYGSKKIFTESYAVEIMPYNEWYIGPEYSFAETIASFIFPNDSPEKPAVETIISHAVKRLKSMINTTAFDGYQSNDPEKVIYQAAAIFEAIQKDIDLTYIYPPSSFEFTGQKVLSPWQVISNRRGTCLDTSVLLAACFERIGLHPVVFMIDGHAFVGFWTIDGLVLASNGAPASKTNDYSVVKEAIENAYIIPVESTLLTDKRFSFENAIATWMALDVKGGKIDFRLPVEKFHCMIDVLGCRMNGIKPMPI